METRLGPQELQREISKINWNQVFYFSLVAAQGSIKKAADVLKLSPSTLSEHISQLESSLETSLFHRQGPKLTLTEAGQRLAWQARQMFESGQQILEAATHRSLNSYPISIGVVPGPHLPKVHTFISRFSKEYNPVQMKVRQTSLEDLELFLVKGNLDFGFSDQPSQRRDIFSHRLLASPIRFYVSDQWSKDSLKEVLQKIPLLLCQSEASTDAFLQKALLDAGISPLSLVKADYPGVLLDMCRNGLGVGAFCEGPEGGFAAGHLHSLRECKDTPKIQTETYLLWAANGESTTAVTQAKRLMIS